MLEKVPDETTIPTSATGWSAADWRTSCSGYQGSPGRARGGGGGLLKKGGIVDATIISVSSTGNGSNARDPGMHRTRKGNQRHSGMKPRIGDC